MKNDIFKQIFIWTLTVACSGSLGYGYSQSTMGNDVRAHETRLNIIDQRINGILQIWEAQLASNRELVLIAKEQFATIRTQNEIIQKLIERQPLSFLK